MRCKIFPPTIGISLVLFVNLCSLAGEVFDSQIAFVEAAGAISTETFEDSPNIGTSDLGGQSLLVFDSFTVTSVPPALKIFDVPMFGNFNASPGGVKYLASDTDIGRFEADLTFNFDDPILSFGLNFIDVDADLTVGINSSQFTVLGLGNGSVSYFGIVADSPFDTIVISGGFEDSFYSIDDVSFASIPEPSSMVFGLGALVMALGRRARHSQIGG